MTFIVEQAHAGIGLQDAGRPGCARLGITSGGAADLTMARLCNVLAGNAPTVLLPLLEIPLGGLALRASEQVVVALCGIGFQPAINGKTVECWRSLRLNSGDVLTTGYSRRAARAYLAVQGGFVATPVLGSCSTVQRENIGGFDGKAGALVAGQLLHHPPSLQYKPVSLAYQHQPRLPAVLTLDLVTAAQWPQLQQVAMTQGQDLTTALAQRLYRVSQQADRMGVRLSGQPLATANMTLYSEGLTSGAVQLPPDGQPIVMHVDHQTIGGYPKLGAITAQSLELVAQALPGQWLKFRPVSAQAALQQERTRQQAIAQSLSRIWQQWQ